ncbi:MAG: hypothetical protein U0670_08930 [Anaerolineae bacterium]
MMLDKTPLPIPDKPLFLLGLFYALQPEFGLDTRDYLALLRALHYRVSIRYPGEPVLNPLEDLVEICQFLWAKSPRDSERIDLLIRGVYALQAVQEYHRFACQCSGIDSLPIDSEADLETLVRLWMAQTSAEASETGALDSGEAEQVLIGNAPHTRSTLVADSAPPADAETPEAPFESVFAMKRPPRPRQMGVETRADALASNDGDEPMRMGDHWRPREHVPVSPLRLRQLWRLQRINQPGTPARVFSLPKTMAQLERHGGLPVPMYQARPSSRARLLIMVDVGEHMEPVERQVKLLLRTFIDSGSREEQIVYFNTLPETDHPDSLDLSDWMVYTQPTITAGQRCRLIDYRAHLIKGRVLIIGDAGATRRSTERVGTRRYTKTMLAFLHMLHASTSDVVWLNPLRQEKWDETPARRIKDKVEMFPYTTVGLELAMKRLRTITS